MPYPIKIQGMPGKSPAGKSLPRLSTKRPNQRGVIRTSVRISGLTSDRGSYGLRYGFGPWFVRFRSVVRTVSVRFRPVVRTVSVRFRSVVRTISVRSRFVICEITVQFRCD